MTAYKEIPCESPIWSYIFYIYFNYYIFRMTSWIKSFAVDKELVVFYQESWNSDESDEYNEMIPEESIERWVRLNEGSKLNRF